MSNSSKLDPYTHWQKCRPESLDFWQLCGLNFMRDDARCLCGSWTSCTDCDMFQSVPPNQQCRSIKNMKIRVYNRTSTSVIPTGAISHPDHPKLHTRWGVSSCRHELTVFFHLLALAANPWAKVRHKGRWPASHPSLPSCQISSPCVNPRRRYPLQNICEQTNKQTNTETVNDISPACLSARGDK